MSEETLSIFITALIIVLMFVWVPVLEFLCPPCGRAFERFRLRKALDNVRQANTSGIKAEQG